jgi:hypothetical protein
MFDGAGHHERAQKQQDYGVAIGGRNFALF